MQTNGNNSRRLHMSFRFIVHIGPHKAYLYSYI